MKVDKLNPKPNGKIDFNFMKLKGLTSEKGCYVLTSFESEIIYIGLANNLQRRLLEHFDSEKGKVVTKYGKVFYVYFVELIKEVDLGKTERGWINQFEIINGELPPLNKVRSPVS